LKPVRLEMSQMKSTTYHGKTRRYNVDQSKSDPERNYKGQSRAGFSPAAWGGRGRKRVHLVPFFRDAGPK